MPEPGTRKVGEEEVEPQQLLVQHQLPAQIPGDQIMTKQRAAHVVAELVIGCFFEINLICAIASEVFGKTESSQTSTRIFYPLMQKVNI